MIPGETIHSGAPKQCVDCDTKFELKVMKTPAGYYIGTECECGPYSRESGYYPTLEAAVKALSEGGYERSSEFTG